MSYCRWSSMDFRCDLYLYESDCGFELHVASNRRVFAEALPDPVPTPGYPGYDFGTWVERHQKLIAIVNRAELAPIEFPHAGESFTFVSPGECADMVDRLVALGYVVPDDLVSVLREEQAELDTLMDAEVG